MKDELPGLREGLLPEAEEVLPPDTSVLDLIDNVLHKGVMVQGEVIIGLAGIDLVYLGITAVLCSADRILPRERPDRPPALLPRPPALVPGPKKR